MALLRKLIVIGEAAGVAAIGLITVVVVYDVVARAAGYPTLWALEVSGYLMVAASVLAAGEVMQKGGHFEVRLFLDMLPRRLQAVIDRLAAAVTALFVVAITIGCAQLVLQTNALGFKSPTLLQVPLTRAKPAPRGERALYLSAGTGFQAAPIYEGRSLRPGQAVEGPALVEERNTTVLLGPGDRLEVDPSNNFSIRVAPKELAS